MKPLRLLFPTLALSFILQLTSAQNWQWAHSIGGADLDIAFKNRTDPNGNVFVSGLFQSPSITIGTTTLTNNGTDAIFLAKYDPSGNFLWAKGSSGTPYNEPFGMATDAWGNVYICGYYQGASITFNSTTLTSANGGDAFLVKYDPMGNVLWAKTAGGNNNDVMWAVTIDNAGNPLVCGYYSGTNLTIGSFTLPNNGGQNAFLAKYDTSGTVTWAKQVSTTQDAGLNGIGVDANGYIYVSGSASVNTGNPATITVNFSSTVQTTITPNNIFIARYDPNGNALWAVHSTGTGTRTDNSALAADAMGNSYITGSFDSTIYFGNLPGLTPVLNSLLTSANAYLAKYDSTGKALWANSGGGASYYNYGADVAVDAYGQSYITGFYQGPGITFGSKTLTSSGIQSAFIVKYNPNGTVALALEPTGPSGITVIGGNSIATDGNGNIITSGDFVNSSAMFGNITITNNGQYDGYVAKYDIGTPLPPIAAFTASNTSVCAGNTVTFTDQSTGTPKTWSWTFTGGTQDTSTAQNPTVTYNMPGTYPVKLLVTNPGGSDSLTKTAYISVGATPKAGVITGPDSICTGNAALLSDTGTFGAIQWKMSADGLSFSDIPGDTSSTNNITGLSQSAYFKVYATTANCPLADSSPVFKVVVNPLPVPVLTTSDSIFCSGDSAHVCTKSTYLAYRWNTSDTTQCITASAAGGYSVKVTDANGCSAVSTPVHISLYPVPVDSIYTGKFIFCSGDTALICSLHTYLRYQWNTSDTGACVPATAAGNYYVTVTDMNGCTAESNRLAISVYPVPSVSIIHQGDTLTSFGAVSYQWLKDNTPLGGDTNSFFIATGPGSYAVEITDSNGCTATSQPVEISGISAVSANSGISIYPNPVTGTVFIKAENTNTRLMHLRISDVLGRTILDKNPGAQPTGLVTLDVSTLQHGVYYVEVSTGEGTYIQPLVKQ